MKSLPLQIGQLSKLFPLADISVPVPDSQEVIQSMLPSYNRACELAETYLRNIAWFFMPVDRKQVMEDLIPIAYRNCQQPGKPGASANSSMQMDPHELALLFAALSLGAVGDLSLPPLNDEGQLYFHCSRAALGLKCVFEESTLATIQAVSTMAAYALYSNNCSIIDGSDKLFSFACMLASQVSLCAIHS